ncbi:MAG: peptidoglycan-binding protein, partial [Bacteroidales bacterium]|nr:peptidoglycan-binding protein [Bacteroidales bacterium]
GAFDDDQIANWRYDIKRRRRFVLIFIAVVWVLFSFSLLVPKSERFGRLSKPILEKIEKVVPQDAPKLLDVESLEPGAKGEEVKVMQEFLKEQGFFKGTPSPTYGPATKKAVQQFQKANGLQETGIADSETIKCINKVAYDLQKMRTE